MKNDEITTFLVNDQEDSNGFSMSWDAIKKNADKWIGVKGILFESCDLTGCKYDHSEGKNLDEALALSDLHEVTKITSVKLDESTKSAFAVQQVTSSDFASKICNGEIEFVSQSIWLDEKPENPDKIHVTSSDKFQPVHIAYISDPAYGKNTAKVTEKDQMCNVFNIGSSNKNMDNETKKEEKQTMSSDDMIKEMHGAIMSMAKSMQKSTEEKPKEKTESSKKPSYSFNWPEQKQESNLLCDLVR